MRAGSDPLGPDRFVAGIDELLPRPVPSRYRLLSPHEQEWRGRACVVLWLLGYSVRTAWLFALSQDPGWSQFIRDGLPDGGREPLDVRVLRRRLAEAQKSG